MIEPATLALFAAAAAGLLVTPGPAVLFVIARSFEHGRTGGLVSTLGLAAGNAVHLAAAIAGMAALVAASPTAFRLLRLAGAGYLVWLGWRALARPGRGDARAARKSAIDRRRLFVQGVTVNLLNPKSGLFFAAFLPQFADPDGGSLPAQLLLLGSLFIALGVVTDAAYALLAAGARGRMRIRRGASRLAAGIYFALGAVALATPGGR